MSTLRHSVLLVLVMEPENPSKLAGFKALIAVSTQAAQANDFPLMHTRGASKFRKVICHRKGRFLDCSIPGLRLDQCVAIIQPLSKLFALMSAHQSRTYCLVQSNMINEKLKCEIL